MRVPEKKDAFKPLLFGGKAKKWLGATVQRFTEKIGGSELGLVLQDGGEPIPGFAHEMGGHWDEVAAEFLLTSDTESSVDK